MAKSRETYNKKEKEKKKLKKQQDKKDRKEERKANSNKGASFEDMLAYVDENGNLTSTPPDPTKKKKVDSESIQIGIPRNTEIADPTRKGVVEFFNDAKGFGFIKDTATLEKIFVHLNGLIDPVKNNDRVTFQVTNTPKGPSAIDVKVIK